MIGAAIGVACSRAGWVQFDRAGDRSYGVLDPDDAARHQPRAKVLLWHDPEMVVGEVEWWERGNLPGLVAVARLDRADLIDTDRDWYWSPGMTSISRSDGSQTSAVINELSLTETPAGTTLPPVIITRGVDLAEAGAPDGLSPSMHLVWRHAVEAARTPSYRRGDQLEIHDELAEAYKRHHTADPVTPLNQDGRQRAGHVRSDDTDRRFTRRLGTVVSFT